MIAYLDFNASAPIEKDVLDYMIDIYRNDYGNANSRTHFYGAQAKSIVETSRKKIADILLLEPMEVIFTSGATESNNMAILGLKEYALQTGKTHFITTAIEHKAVREPMKYLQELGFDVDFIYPREDGSISAEDVINRVTDKTALVSVMHVNSETGIIQPVKEIGDYLKNTKTWFHVDATQSFGKMNEELKKIKYDLLSISAHKIRGPQGVGGLIIKNRNNLRTQIKPLFFGGGQEFKIRPGTVPVALVGGFGEAAYLCQKVSLKRKKECLKIKEKFMQSISDLDYRINGDQNKCIPNTINISFDNVDAEAFFVATKEYYAVSNGAACVSGSYEPSYVLNAMGLDKKRISNAIRLSWDYDTQVDFNYLVSFIKGEQEEE